MLRSQSGAWRFRRQLESLPGDGNLWLLIEDCDMRQPFTSGASFGLTSGIITTLGLMVGLHSGTHSRSVVLGGILTIAIADAMSDALGMHLAQESVPGLTTGEIWEATLATFLSKFVVAMSFVVPVLLLSLPLAMGLSVAWGLLLLGLLSFALARMQGVAPAPVIAEHVMIAVVVIAITHYVGQWIAGTFA